MLRLLAFLAVLCLAFGGWVDLYKFPWTGVPLPITTSLACPNSTICFVTGGTSSSLPLVHYTTDNFKTFTLANYTEGTLLLIDIAFDSTGKYAVAGGAGALKLPGIQYSTDAGYSWRPTADIALIAATRVASMGGEKFAFMGTFNALLNEEGVGVSVNGGRNWRDTKWPKTQVPAGCAPGAGQFFGDTWYIACGSEPQEEESSSEPEEEDESIQTIPLKSKRYSLAYNKKYKMSKMLRQSVGAYLRGNYTGGILKTTDSGATWTNQFKEAGQYDLGDICCASATNCIAVGQGIGSFGAQTPGSTILATTDGSTWSVVESYAQPMLIDRCRYVDDGTTNGAYWLAGAVPTSSLNTYAVFLKSTDGGKTFVDSGDHVKGIVGIIDFNFVVGSKGTKGYALGGTVDNVITPLEYTA